MIGAELSAEDAGRFHRGLIALAKSLFGPEDPRTLDQQCADVFAQLPDFAIAHLADTGSTTCTGSDCTCTCRPTTTGTDPDAGSDAGTDAGTDTGADADPGRGAMGGADGGRGCGGRPAGAGGHDGHCGHSGGPGLRQFLGLLGPGSALTRRQARKIQAVVLIPCETALDLADHAAELIDYGPITSFHARDLLAAAELRKACTDLRTGRLVALEDHIFRPTGNTWVPSLLELQLLTMVDRPTPVETRTEPGHDPSPGLTDFIRLRDTRCVGPGCSMPAHRCDLDHLQPHPDGTTSADNLGPASRRCHNAKTYGGWTLHPHPDGSITWTSPLGMSFTRLARTEPADLTDLRPPPRRTPTAEGSQEGDGDTDEPAPASGSYF